MHFGTTVAGFLSSLPEALLLPSEHYTKLGSYSRVQCTAVDIDGTVVVLISDSRRPSQTRHQQLPRVSQYLVLLGGAVPARVVPYF